MTREVRSALILEERCYSMHKLPDLAAAYVRLRATYFTTSNGNALPPIEQVTVEWSNRLTSSAGICYPRQRIIRLSTHYHQVHPTEIQSTLLHEMIHLIVPGHGPAFYQWLERIRLQGGHVTRYAVARATDHTPRWRYTCRLCGRQIKRYRRMSNGGRFHRHRDCGGTFSEEAIRPDVR